MARKGSTTRVPNGTEGGIGAFALLVGLIVLLVLAAAYSVKTSNVDGDSTAGGNGGRSGQLVSANGKAAKRPGSVQSARARAVAARIARARRAVKRARARAAARARRARTTYTVTVVREVPAYSAGGQGICAPLGPSGGGKMARQARAFRRRQRRAALRQLNLHC
jgi:hypothetical protein